MKRLTKYMAITGAIIAAAMFGAATPSAMADTSALGLGCYVDSPAFDVMTADYCVATHAAPSYTVVFEVLGRSGGAYTYNWRPPYGFRIIGGSCTSSSPYCSVTVDSKRPWSKTMSVVVTELATGSSKTVTAVAEGSMVCASWISRWEFC